MESPGQVETSPRKRWFQFLLILFFAEMFVQGSKVRTGGYITSFLGDLIAETFSVFIAAYLLSLFAKKEKRFRVCCCIAAVIFCLLYISD
jgi:hypothetical protein